MKITVGKQFIELLSIALSGNFNYLVTGSQDTLSECEYFLSNALKEILPSLKNEKKQQTERIYQIAKVENSNPDVVPFRHPDPLVTIENVCGGGAEIKPGEISLAHNGILFLDHAAEYRSSVLQMLRVPLESKSITLCRAGKSVCYPADFTLIMTSLTCPCGNYGSKNKICLCSAKSINMFWRKFSAPLLDRIALTVKTDIHNDKIEVDTEELKERIEQIRERQYKKFGKLCSELSIEELENEFKKNDSNTACLLRYVEKYNLSFRKVLQLKKLSVLFAVNDDKDLEPKHIENAFLVIKESNDIQKLSML